MGKKRERVGCYGDRVAERVVCDGDSCVAEREREMCDKKSFVCLRESDRQRLAYLIQRGT